MWYVMPYILSALPLNRSYNNEECTPRLLEGMHLYTKSILMLILGLG